MLSARIKPLNRFKRTSHKDRTSLTVLQHLYAETLLCPGLGLSFQWRFQNNGQGMLSIIDPESPTRGAIDQALERFEYTVFELAANKPTLIEWANSQHTLEDPADLRELRLASAHVLQQSIELFQGMQMMTDRSEDPVRLSAIHHNIGDVMGCIGQRSGSVHFLEQAALSYEQALELRTLEETPNTWAQTSFNMAVVMQTLGQLEDDTGFMKQALQLFKEVVNHIPREDVPEDWASAMCHVATLLCQLGTHRRGARTLEQALVAFQNASGERSVENNQAAWITTQNNLAATLQALGEHEEDIGSLEASIPVYDALLKGIDADAMPLVFMLISANRASAQCALAGESDYLDMAEMAVAAFENIADQLQDTEYSHYRDKATEQTNRARELVSTLQV